MDFSSLSGFLSSLTGAMHAGNYRLCVALALVGLVALARWGAPKLHDSLGDFLNSDRGGALLTLLGGMGAAFAASFGAGAPLSWATLLDGATVGFTAAGGYAILKKLWAPSDAPPPATPAN